MYLSVVDRKRFRDEAQSVYEGHPAQIRITRLLTWTWPRWIPLDDTARGLERFQWLEREAEEVQISHVTGLGTGKMRSLITRHSRRASGICCHTRRGPSWSPAVTFFRRTRVPRSRRKINDFLERIDESKP